MRAIVTQNAFFLLFFYFSDLVPFQPQGKALFWSNSIIKPNVSTNLRYPGVCHDAHVMHTCSDDCMCQNRQGRVLVRFDSKIKERVNEICVHVCARLRQLFETWRKMCHSANGAEPENGNGLFSMTFRNLNAVAQGSPAVTSRKPALELVGVAEETVATSLAGLTVYLINGVGEQDKLCAKVERLKADLEAVCKQASDQEALQGELRYVQESSARLKPH